MRRPNYLLVRSCCSFHFPIVLCCEVPEISIDSKKHIEGEECKIVEWMVHIYCVIYLKAGSSHEFLEREKKSQNNSCNVTE